MPDDASESSREEVIRRLEALRSERVEAKPRPGISREQIEAISARLEAIRARRTWRGRDISIAGLVTAVEREASHRQAHLGEIVSLWEDLVPAALARRTVITGLRRGVLDVTAESAADVYELDGLLRAGLLAALRRGCRRTLVRVRVTVGSGGAQRKRGRRTR